MCEAVAAVKNTDNKTLSVIMKSGESVRISRNSQLKGWRAFKLLTAKVIQDEMMHYSCR